MTEKTINLQPQTIKVISAGLDQKQADFDYTMTELSELARADGLTVVQQITQVRPLPDGATYFGRGKVQEIKQQAQANDVQILLVNAELSPSQLANLEKKSGLQVIDRTELILRIFAQRARTRAAKAQVEIARLQYALPRIHPSENTLDQQRGSGGLANRGSGETASELNRRTIRNQINELKRQLQAIQKAAQTQSQRRRQSDLPQVALVGYTNAGKSTTLNGLLKTYEPQAEQKHVVEKNMLFATLDTSVREVKLPNRQRFLLSDTVGFVSHLPHHLVESFKSTLAEAAQADLLIQVIDYADPHYREMMQTTKRTLEELGITDIPMIYAFNKADLRQPTTTYPEVNGSDLIYSAQDTRSLKALAKLIQDHIFQNYQPTKLLLPFTHARELAEIEGRSQVLAKTYTEKGAKITAMLSPRQQQRYHAFVRI